MHTLNEKAGSAPIDCKACRARAVFESFDLPRGAACPTIHLSACLSHSSLSCSVSKRLNVSVNELLELRSSIRHSNGLTPNIVGVRPTHSAGSYTYGM